MEYRLPPARTIGGLCSPVGKQVPGGGSRNKSQNFAHNVASARKSGQSPKFALNLCRGRTHPNFKKNLSKLWPVPNNGAPRRAAWGNGKGSTSILLSSFFFTSILLQVRRCLSPSYYHRKVPQRKWRAHGSGAASQWGHAGGASRRRVGPGEGASPKARVPVG